MREYNEIIWNMDPAVLKNGGRKAPIMTMEEFKSILFKVFSKYFEIGNNMSDIEEALTEAVIEEYPFVSKFIKDIRKVNFDTENVLVDDFYVGANGIPYLLVYMGGDWEIPVYAMLYWDDKSLRGYVPTYGNSFNAYTKTAFGSEQEYFDDLDGIAHHTYTYKADGVIINGSFETFDDYRTVVMWTTVDKMAMDEDFSHRVETI